MPSKKLVKKTQAVPQKRQNITVKSTVSLNFKSDLPLGKIHMLVNGTHYQRAGSAAYIQELQTLGVNAHNNQDPYAYQQLMLRLNPYQAALDAGVFQEAEDGSIYLENIPIPVPKALVKTMVQYVSAGHPIEPLKRFWFLCCLNPNTRSRDDFFKYCLDFGVVITNTGHVVLYKAVTHKQVPKSKAISSDLQAFIAQEYLEVTSKTRYKKPDRYAIYEISRKNDQGEIEKEYVSERCVAKDGSIDKPSALHAAKAKRVGILSDLFDNIQNLETEFVYTDKYTKKMNIQIGVPVKQDRDKCDPDINNACSKGLHIGSFKYVEQFAHSSDTILACLVNPMNIVAIPEYDTSKIRCCEYLPYARITRFDDGTWDEIAPRHLDVTYVSHQAEDIESAAKVATVTIAEEAKARMADLKGGKNPLSKAVSFLKNI